MSSYASLAGWYDALTGDVPYEAFADFYEAEFAQNGGEFRLLLDYCCGTGTLTAEMARRGYEMIGTDASVDMLMQAQEKCASLPCPPLFLNQRAEEMDLYGTVDAALCSLDGMNYLPPQALPELFRRLHLFVRPGGRERGRVLPLAGRLPGGGALHQLRDGPLRTPGTALEAQRRGASGVCPRARGSAEAHGTGGLSGFHAASGRAPAR